MNTELEDNIKSALSSNPALRDKILALIPAKNSVVTPDTELEKEFVEKGADLEHTRWAKWQAYLHSKCVEHENGKGEWVCFPAELYRRWERQINTPYAELSEVEKESDRKEVRSYLPLLSSRDTYWKERVRKEVEAEIQLFMETLQKRADTVPPQLLLNEVVNYAYDRLQTLDNLK